MPTKMNQLFDQIHKIPQVPEVVRSIINQLNNPNADMLDIAKNVEKEQVIVLKILRLVNSAHFGLSRKIGSIDEAITMLGMNQLKTLVIASGIVSVVPQLDNFDVKQSWRNSFRTAGYAKWFAAQAGLAADIAYTAGLISNLGNILIHIGSPREANEIDQHVKNGNPRLEIEKRRLGYSSQAICAELCRRWKFADELVETIEQSAEPLLLEIPNKLACAVFLAHAISDYQDQGLDANQILASLPKQVTELLGLSEQVLEEKIPDVLAAKSELDGLLD
ncbi:MULTISPECIES: HDOD domain-containing protein [Methylomonas]|uniref:Signal transduction protein n=2 Tax=Methylomonas TaxID=416 RepID=A0A140E6E4_9GAMM|nr:MULTISPECIES: HDOD domain-containing protein [Methylomonas]AMK78968.1 signal transduction protein [Methylomonas denitrificans]OAH99178.1 signal transduction protein [Methylomonas methanica]TCV77457.1 HD-like signal output (HDOD) protein [Methylomonas methanica]